ncbi:MAG: IclR family transcriptional regulator [Granulosicoccaceae bacterium]
MAESSPRQNSGENKNASALVRGLRLLRLICVSEPLRFSELQVRSALPKGTLHRTLADLSSEGLISLDEATQTYRGGLQLLEWANRLWADSDLRSLTHDLLQELADESGETALLYVPADTAVVAIDTIESRESLRTAIGIGSQAPAWCSAPGKALLAWLEPPQQRDILDRCAITRFTPHTTTDREAILGDLAQVREQGVAIDNEEHFAGIVALAAPLLDYRGAPVAALGLSAPSFRIETKQLELWKQRISEAARAASRRLPPMGDIK